VDWLSLSQGLTTLYWGIGSPLSDHESMLNLPASLHVSIPNLLISFDYHANDLLWAKPRLSTVRLCLACRRGDPSRLMPLRWDWALPYQSYLACGLFIFITA
jgi:hypothetical protein